MTKRNGQTSKSAVGVALILASILILLGYNILGNPQFAAAIGVTPPPATASPMVPLSAPAAPAATPIVSYFRHIATGTADILWDQTTKTLNVKLTMSGLAPGSTHPAHIHKGSCETSDNGVLYPLNAVVADNKGTVTSKTTIQKVADGIPASGWFINVHNGPTLSPSTQKTSIACGDITNLNTSIASTQVVDLTLWSTKDPNQAVSGQATYSIVGGQLIVTLTVSGLAPNSTHIAHIHQGSCKNQGAVLYPLKNLVADKNGVATSVTPIAVTTIPANMYINIHLASLATDLATQTGFDPIACTNVPSSSGQATSNSTAP
jgi:hypothetical protein